MRIFFSAGEPSGDQHAAHLIHELQSRRSDFKAEGFGGPEMRRHGCSLHFELTQLAVMGFLRVVPLIAKFRRLVKQAEAHFATSPPDAVVLIDFPGFNWWIARAARRRGIPVYYYLPPQLWAWAGWRIRRVRKWVDHVICTLPFEYDWYKSRGVKTTWVGHPFFDEVAARTLDESLIQRLRDGAAGHAPTNVIALLPGSRNHEVDRNFPLMLEVVRQVSQAVRGIRWVVANYRAEHTATCEDMQHAARLPDNIDIQFVAGRTPEAIEAADCCLMVSGSVSLELLARRKPGVVLYRGHRIGLIASYFLMKCRFITLVNLIADDEIMPEFISVGDPAEHIRGMAGQLVEWCCNRHVLERKVAEMSALADQAAITGATGRVADLLERELTAAGGATPQQTAEAA